MSESKQLRQQIIPQEYTHIVDQIKSVFQSSFPKPTSHDVFIFLAALKSSEISLLEILSKNGIDVHRFECQKEMPTKQ